MRSTIHKIPLWEVESASSMVPRIPGMDINAPDSSALFAALSLPDLNLSGETKVLGIDKDGNIVITTGGGGAGIWGSITGTLSNQTDLQNALNTKANVTALFSGKYTDLTSIPTFASVATSGSYNDLLNLPTLFSGSYTDLTNKPSLFSGNYNDLSNKPAIPTDLSGLTDTTSLLFSRAYADLTGKPSIPTKVSDLTNDSGFITGLSSFDTGDLSEGSNLYFTNARADARITTQKGAASGIAPLNSSSKIDTTYLPALAITSTFVVASEAAQLALTAQEGDVAIRSDLNKSFIHNGGTAGTMADWSELLTPTDAVLSVDGATGAVDLSGTYAALSHTHTASEITDFDTEVANNTAVTANTAKISFDSASSTKLDAIEALADVTDAANVAAAGAVMNTGAETIAGVKTFSSSPIVPTPTTDMQASTKKYVDDAITGAGGYNDESAQDAVGGMLTDSTEIDFTYDDATPSITASLKAGSIDETKLDTSVNASLDLADSATQPADLALDNLSDVDTSTTAPTDGQVLSWDNTAGLWKPASAASGGSGIALTDLSASSPLAYNNTTGVFSIPKATASADGYLSQADWATFNGKADIADLFGGAFSDLTAHPTTIAGYGITDAFDGTFSSLTGKPTSISGYGITDAFDGAYSSLTGTPTIPTDLSNLTDTTSLLFSGSYTDLTNKPSIPDALTDLGTTVTGAQLNALKTKVDGIASGAEVNVQSDWQAVSGDAQILNKPTIPTNNNQLTNGAGYALTSQLFSGAYTDLSGKPSIPSALSDLTNITVAATAPASPSTGDVWVDTA